MAKKQTPTATDVEASVPAADPAYSPSRTALGERLRALRRILLQEGAQGLDWEAIEREVARRRGDVSGSSG